MMKRKSTLLLTTLLAGSVIAACGSTNAATATSTASAAASESVSAQSTSASDEKKSSGAKGPFVLEEYEYYNQAYDKFGFVYTAKDIQELKETPSTQQGTVETIEYETPAYAVNAVTGGDYTITKKANVYLPYGYDASKEYNIVYLMHGGGDDEDVWLMDGDSNQGEFTRNLLDNMIEQGLSEPVIVVTPTFYSDVPDVEISDEDCADVIAEIGEPNFNGMMTLHTWFFGDELRNDLVPAIESKYSTYADGDTSIENLIASRDHRAYAGLSMGSMVSMHGILMRNTDILSYVGSYSGAKTDVSMFKEALDASDYDIHFWFNGNGTEDIAFNDHLQFYQDVTKEMDYRFQDGENCALVIINDGYHAFGAWEADLYNSLLVFFKVGIEE